MPQLLLPPPSEKQRLFLADRHKYVAYGGARGGGKSWAVRVKAALLAERYPGIKLMIVRRTYPELQENHILPLCALLHCFHEDPRERLAVYNDTKKHIVFPNGSRILFRYCETDKDAERFQGTETDVLFIDEATHQSEERMKKLTACVRGVNAFPKRIYLTCNPGSEGHAWVKRLFIDRRYREGENPADYSFIPALVTDNKALMAADPGYIRQLEALPPKLRKAWLYGQWDVFEGQFFEDFVDDPKGYVNRQFTHVIEPFTPPADWRVYRSFDWGYNRPFSCGWWAIDRDGVAYRIAEYYGCTETPNEGLRWEPNKVFSELRRVENEHPLLAGRHIAGVADPAIWDAERGDSIADIAARHRIYFEPGDNKRIPGWMQLHYRLSFDENGYPLLYVFKSCRAFIRTIPALLFDARNSEDLDTSQEDHVADETRYFLMAHPIRPRADRQSAKERSPAIPALDLCPGELKGGGVHRRVEMLD